MNAVDRTALDRNVQILLIVEPLRIDAAATVILLDSKRRWRAPAAVFAADTALFIDKDSACFSWIFVLGPRGPDTWNPLAQWLACSMTKLSWARSALVTCPAQQPNQMIQAASCTEHCQENAKDDCALRSSKYLEKDQAGSVDVGLWYTGWSAPVKPSSSS
jgi:hypothetical protein